MDLLEAVTATYAVVGQDISDIGLRAVVIELQSYPEMAVLEALSRCRKELRKMTLADILDRLPGGHPKPEEAWAIVAPCLDNEEASIVWTDEMASAFGVASHLKDDKIAARLAFKETYTEAIARARANKMPPVWRASLGFDPKGREVALREAAEKGRITLEYADKLLPPPDYAPAEVRALARRATGEMQ